MNERLHRNADGIICSSMSAVLPGEAVRRVLIAFRMEKGCVLLEVAGKAVCEKPYRRVNAR